MIPQYAPYPSMCEAMRDCGGCRAYSLESKVRAMLAVIKDIQSIHISNITEVADPNPSSLIESSPIQSNFAQSNPTALIPTNVTNPSALSANLSLSSQANIIDSSHLSSHVGSSLNSSIDASAKSLQYDISHNIPLHVYVPPISCYRARGEFRIQHMPHISQPTQRAYHGTSSHNAYAASISNHALADATSCHSSKNSPYTLELCMNAKSAHKKHMAITHCPILLPSLQLCLKELMPLLASTHEARNKLYALEILGARFSTHESLAKNALMLDSKPNACTQSTPEISTHTIKSKHRAITYHYVASDMYQCSDVVISLIYHKALDATYTHAMKPILIAFMRALKQSTNTHHTIANVTLIARSKKQKIIFPPLIITPKPTSKSPTTLQSTPIMPHKSFAMPQSTSMLTSQQAPHLHHHKPFSSSQDATSHMPLSQCSSYNYAYSHAHSHASISYSLPNDIVRDIVSVCGKSYIYMRKEGQFCQPNAYMNPCMLSFVKDILKTHKRNDLLEMYGGDGNFSIALAELFHRVLVTEVVKASSHILACNAALNNISHIFHARLSGIETKRALEGEREFFRLRHIDIGAFDFSHILIDPPRSGINDEELLRFIASFSTIIYISCSLNALSNDIKFFAHSHHLAEMAFFEQFPHTHHGEYALILRKKA